MLEHAFARATVPGTVHEEEVTERGNAQVPDHFNSSIDASHLWINIISPSSHTIITSRTNGVTKHCILTKSVFLKRLHNKGCT